MWQLQVYSSIIENEHDSVYNWLTLISSSTCSYNSTIIIILLVSQRTAYHCKQCFLASQASDLLVYRLEVALDEFPGKGLNLL